ncbi:alpha/beta hydrolase [Streptomyces sp. NPDC091268]|uniref:alpha/beta hydrolase n=1 Tax=Streptomyces sp. NPDC091268 TaxID=3365979 RepID=UPI00382E58AB
MTATAPGTPDGGPPGPAAAAGPPQPAAGPPHRLDASGSGPEARPADPSGPGDRLDPFAAGPGDRLDPCAAGPGDRPDPSAVGPGDRPDPSAVGPGDRLDPAVRPYVEAMAAVFPDLGGAVTDAVEARRMLAALPGARGGGPVPAVGGVADREVPGPPGAPPLRVRIYRPDPRRWPGPRPTVVFCHGGGWVLCDLDSHDTLVRRLCRASGAVFVSVDYRRAPEARFPAAALDAYAALRWAGAHLAELGGDPAALVVAGDSAGANLAAASLLAARDGGGPAVALQVLLYPALDAARNTASYRADARGCFLTAAHMEWFWEQYLGPGGDGRDPLASPLAADPTGLPPAHVLVAGCDPLRDEGEAYHHRLIAHGVPSTLDAHPGMFHGFLALEGVLPHARRALEELGGVIASARMDRKTSGGPGGGAG